MADKRKRRSVAPTSLNFIAARLLQAVGLALIFALLTHIVGSRWVPEYAAAYSISVFFGLLSLGILLTAMAVRDARRQQIYTRALRLLNLASTTTIALEPSERAQLQEAAIAADLPVRFEGRSKLAGDQVGLLYLIASRLDEDVHFALKHHVLRLAARMRLPEDVDARVQAALTQSVKELIRLGASREAQALAIAHLRGRDA